MLGACGQVVDVGEKEGRFAGGPPPAGWALVEAWPAATPLCATGRAQVRFDAPAQVHAFPVRVPAGGRGLAVASGASGLDLTLAVYGPRDALGGFGEAPAVVDDDGLGGAPGEPRGASLTWTADAASTWLLVVSTWQGQGRGDATVTLAVDGVLGCPACVDGALDGAPGCEPTCEVSPCNATAAEWMAFEQKAGRADGSTGCYPVDPEVNCRLRTAAEGAGWVAAMDGALEAAEQAGAAPGSAGTLRCLAAGAAPRAFEVATSPDGQMLELVLGAPLVDATVPGAEAALAHVGRVAGLDEDSTTAWTWRALADGGTVGTLDVRSWRGLAVDDALPAVVAWLDAATSCPDRVALGRVTVWRAVDRSTAAEPGVDASGAGDAAKRRCGPSCAVVATTEALRGATRVWRVTLDCPSACGRCLARVDAASGGVLTFEPYCPEIDATGRVEAAGAAFLGAPLCGATDGAACWRLEGGLLTTGTCAGGTCGDDGSRECRLLEAQWRAAAGQSAAGLCQADADCSVIGGAGACGEIRLLGAAAGTAVTALGRGPLEELEALYRASTCDSWRALGARRSWGVRPTYAASCLDGRCTTRAEVCP